MTEPTTYLALVADNDDGSVRVVKRYDDVSLEDYERFLANIAQTYDELPRLKQSDDALKSLSNILRVIISDFNLLTPNGIDMSGLGHAVMAVALQYADNPVDTDNQPIDLHAKISGLLFEQNEKKGALAKAMSDIKNEVVLTAITTVLDFAKAKAKSQLVSNNSGRNYRYDQATFEANMPKYQWLFAQSQSQLKEWLMLMQNNLLTAQQPQKLLNEPITEIPTP